MPEAVIQGPMGDEGIETVLPSTLVGALFVSNRNDVVKVQVALWWFENDKCDLAQALDLLDFSRA